MQPQHKTLHNWLALKTANEAFLQYRDRFIGTVADLGCGRAPYKQDILITAKRYIGVDWSNSMHGTNAVDVISDLNDRIDLASDSVDAAMVMHVLEHLSEPERFLNETWRILKPGGFLLIAVPFNWHLHEEPYDFYRYTPHCLHYILNKHNFTSIVVKAEGGVFSTITLKVNYLLCRVARGPLRYLCMPFYALNQQCAQWLDAAWPSPWECIAVTAVAAKPK